MRLKLLCEVWALCDDSRVARERPMSEMQACCQLLSCWALSLNLEHRVRMYCMKPSCTWWRRESGECGGVGRNLAPFDRRKMRWSLWNILISVVMT